MKNPFTKFCEKYNSLDSYKFIDYQIKKRFKFDFDNNGDIILLCYLFNSTTPNGIIYKDLTYRTNYKNFEEIINSDEFYKDLNVLFDFYYKDSNNKQIQYHLTKTSKIINNCSNLSKYIKDKFNKSKFMKLSPHDLKINLV